PSELEVSVADSLGQWSPEVPRPVALRIQGNDPALLEPLLLRIREALSSLPAIKALRVDGASQRQHLQARLDRQAAARHGILPDDVSLAMSVALARQVVGEVPDGDERLPVLLRSGGERELPGALKNFMLKGQGGALVPLTELVSLTEES